MVLKKQLLLLLSLLFLSFISMAGVHLDPDHSSVKDTLKNNYFDPNHRSLTDSVVNFGKFFLKTPYHFGSPGVSSFDCSGFTSYVYRNFGYKLEHSSADQANQFDSVDRCQLKAGDLVFFSGHRRSKHVGHVGIVTLAKENGEFDFIHAAVHSGVTISNSSEEYYTKRFVKASRVVNANQMLAITKFIAKSEKPLAESIAFSPVSTPAREVKKVIPAEYHHVKSGESLSTISKKYGMTITELKRKNHIKGNKLSPKQDLLIKDEETVMIVQSIPSNDNSTPAITGNSETNISGMSKGDQQLEKIKIAKLHSVKKGETLFSISKLYNISIDELKNINKTIKGKIHPGQRLQVTLPLVPVKRELATMVEESSKVTTHKVLSRETLFGISKSYNIPVDELKKMNNMADSKIHQGQELKVIQMNDLNTQEDKKEIRQESKTFKSEKEISLKIKKGETLGSIAKANNTTVDELKKLNNLNSSKIHQGQVIKINQKTEDKTQEAVADKIEKKTSKTIEKPVSIKIHQGETLGGIAKANNTTVGELKRINNLKDSKLHLGQVLKLNQNVEPNTQNRVAESTDKKKEGKAEYKGSSITHKIKRGESLIMIAKDNNISVEELKEMNNLTDSKIRFGQELKLSQSAEKKKPVDSKVEKESKSIAHKVKSGESFYSIAKLYGCSVDELKNWNQKSGSKIKVGQKIIILSDNK